MSFVKKAFKGIKKVFKKIWKPLLIVGLTFFTAGLATVGFSGFSAAMGQHGLLGAVGSTIKAGFGATVKTLTGFGSGAQGTAAMGGGVEGAGLFSGRLAQSMGMAQRTSPLTEISVTGPKSGLTQPAGLTEMSVTGPKPGGLTEMSFGGPRSVNVSRSAGNWSGVGDLSGAAGGSVGGSGGFSGGSGGFSGGSGGFSGSAGGSASVSAGNPYGGLGRFMLAQGVLGMAQAHLNKPPSRKPRQYYGVGKDESYEEYLDRQDEYDRMRRERGVSLQIDPMTGDISSVGGLAAYA